MGSVYFGLDLIDDSASDHPFKIAIIIPRLKSFVKVL